MSTPIKRPAADPQVMWVVRVQTKGIDAISIGTFLFSVESEARTFYLHGQYECHNWYWDLGTYNVKEGPGMLNHLLAALKQEHEERKEDYT